VAIWIIKACEGCGVGKFKLIILLDIVHRYLDSFDAFALGTSQGRALRVRQQQTHRLYVAGVTQLAQFLSKSPSVHHMAQQRT
jgi:hypothetical protein